MSRSTSSRIAAITLALSVGVLSAQSAEAAQKSTRSVIRQALSAPTLLQAVNDILFSIAGKPAGAVNMKHHWNGQGPDPNVKEGSGICPHGGKPPFGNAKP